MFTTKRMRPLLTLVCVIIGGLIGNWVADIYIDAMRVYLSGDHSNFLWFIPQLPTRVTPLDNALLRTVSIVLGAMIGFIIERLLYTEIIRIKLRWKRKTALDKAGLLIGIVLGLIFTVSLNVILDTSAWVNAALAIVLCYICALTMENIIGQIKFYSPAQVDCDEKKSKRNHDRIPKLLDTNVIIDGRIADICKAGFLEDPIYIPKFVLEELQLISDSSDSLKRARGRRGLDILRQMQKELDMEISDFDGDDPSQDVDSRLVLVANHNNAAIVTNDFNLNKVAELQGVMVLNINELANALKPVVLPGEQMKVTINKEGKEREQGIGYLDDGTMVVVEGGRHQIGETLLVIVTSVLQTAQGKMIFTRSVEDDTNNYNNIHATSNNYTDYKKYDGSYNTNSSGRPRRKTW